MSLAWDAPAAVAAAVDDLRAAFATGLTRPLAFRRAQLRALSRMLATCTDELHAALHADLRKATLEAHFETSSVEAEIKTHLEQLEMWAAPERPGTNLLYALDTMMVRKEPKGVVLIIGPWNYPAHLVLMPLVGALAAGNTVLIKPSEVAPHTARALTEMLPRFLDRRVVRVVNGGAEETSHLLEHFAFDHIFYTGSTAVGRIVMAAAAKHLTPVTLELGGKCPALIDDHVDIDTVAKRIVWGKFINAGQTCIAPDYVLCHANVHDALVQAMKKHVDAFYGASDQDKRDSPSLARVINERHWDRLHTLLSNTKGTVLTGGHGDRDTHYLAPTLVDHVAWDDALMDNEIFGPILPILTYSAIDTAVREINARPHPLAIYIFSKNKALVQHIMDHTRSGAVVVNDVITHVTAPGVPFGGVGASGMGQYHGRDSFDTFTHRRTTMWRPHSLERVNDVRYPPYTDSKTRLAVSALTGDLDRKVWGSVKLMGGIALGAALAMAASSWASRT